MKIFLAIAGCLTVSWLYLSTDNKNEMDFTIVKEKVKKTTKNTVFTPLEKKKAAKKIITQREIEKQEDKEIDEEKICKEWDTEIIKTNNISMQDVSNKITAEEYIFGEYYYSEFFEIKEIANNNSCHKIQYFIVSENEINIVQDNNKISICSKNEELQLFSELNGNRIDLELSYFTKDHTDMIDDNFVSEEIIEELKSFSIHKSHCYELIKPNKPGKYTVFSGSKLVAEFHVKTEREKKVDNIRSILKFEESNEELFELEALLEKDNIDILDINPSLFISLNIENIYQVTKLATSLSKETKSKIIDLALKNKDKIIEKFTRKPSSLEKELTNKFIPNFYEKENLSKNEIEELYEIENEIIEKGYVLNEL